MKTKIDYGRHVELSKGRSAKDIVRAANMSDRPGYTSGRGATMSDLTGGSFAKFTRAWLLTTVCPQGPLS